MIEAMKTWTKEKAQSFRDRIGFRLLGVYQVPQPPKPFGERLLVDLSISNVEAVRDYARNFPCSIDETINVILEVWAFERRRARAERAEKC